MHLSFTQRVYTYYLSQKPIERFIRAIFLYFSLFLSESYNRFLKRHTRANWEVLATVNYNFHAECSIPQLTKCQSCIAKIMLIQYCNFGYSTVQSLFVWLLNQNHFLVNTKRFNDILFHIKCLNHKNVFTTCLCELYYGWV